jgi:hypothetical protein
LGLADMASAINEGRPHRADGALAYHVLEVGLGLLEAAETRSCRAVISTCERPAPLPDVQPGRPQ